VLSDGAWNSFAGINTLVFFETATGRVWALDGSFGIPMAEADPMSIPARPELRGRTALMASFPAALQAAHDRFGKLSFAAAFQPPILLGKRGFRSPATWRVWGRPAGRSGPRAREGSGFLYRSDWAQAFVQAVCEEDGRITLEDLARYRGEWVALFHTTYRGLQVFGPGAPAIGSVQTLEALNLREASGPADGPGEPGTPCLVRCQGFRGLGRAERMLGIP